MARSAKPGRRRRRPRRALFGGLVLAGGCAFPGIVVDKDGAAFSGDEAGPAADRAFAVRDVDFPVALNARAAGKDEHGRRDGARNA